jgi:hypothetical protein
LTSVSVHELFEQQDNPAQDNVSQDNNFQDNIPQDNISQNSTDQNNISQVNLSQDNFSQDNLSQDNFSQDNLSQDNISQDNIFQNNIAQNKTAQENIMQDNISQDNLSLDNTLQNLTQDLQDVNMQDIGSQEVVDRECIFVRLHERVSQHPVPNYRGARISVPSNLNISAWRASLCNYHDYVICDMLEFGWPVNYDYATYEFPVADKRNHNGALSFDLEVTRYIRQESQNGTIAGPFVSCPFKNGNVMVSPLNSVPKAESEERRIILDLSWPLTSSVNAGIPINEYDGKPCILTYPSVDTIAELILKTGAGCLLYKRDLRKAYRQFPIDPRDYPLVGFLWHDLLYFDVVLPMGLRSAAMACQRVTSGVSFLCGLHDFNVLNYLDDFMGVEVPDTAWTAYEFLGKLLGDLGLRESTSKACPPSTSVTCLGVQFDTQAMTMSVTHSRIIELEELLHRWKVKTSCTKRQLQSLIGKLAFVSKCVRQSRIFLCRMLELLRSLNHNHHCTRLSSCFHKDLRWWQSFLRHYNGVSLIPSLKWSLPDHIFSTDACLTGCGGLAGDLYFHTKFPKFILKEEWPIHKLEMITIMVAVRLWEHKWKGMNITVFCDNEAVVAVLNSGKTKDSLLATCVREIWLCTARGEFQLRAVHLSTSANRLADCLSRWHLNQSAEKQFRQLTNSEVMTEVEVHQDVFLFSDEF